MAMIRHYFLLALLLVALLPKSATAVDVQGRVIDSKTGTALAAASVRIVEASLAVATDDSGHFKFDAVPPGHYTFSVSYVGYQPVRLEAVLDGEHAEVSLRLDPTVLPGEEVLITTTRVSSQTDAVPHSNLTREEIQRDHGVEDVPMLLSGQPGAYAYSDAGNGVGYSYLQIRGFDQRRISVLLNGVPQNDPESQQVYWVDLPDILESATDIQVQRGVGASLYGASAAGGVVSMETNPFSQKPRLSLDLGYGSYGTHKFKLEGNSGLIDGRYGVYGRFSRIESDGYRDQSWVDQWSYFVGLARYDGSVTNRFHAFGGPENLHLAYLGVDSTTLASNRRFNPLEYQDETDNFNQPHYELLTDWAISDRLSLSNSLFYIKGDGYYIQSWPYSSFGDLGLSPIYTQDSLAFDPIHYETVVTDTQFVQDLAAYGDTLWHQVENTTFRRDTLPSGDTVFTVNQLNNAVLQRWVQNDFAGVAPRFKYTHTGGALQFGGSFDRHHGYHYGLVRSAEPAPAGFLAGQPYYGYDGYRTSAIGFVEEHLTLAKRVHVSAALQYSWRRYSLRNDTPGNVTYDLDYSAWSPRLGVLLRVTPEQAVYLNAAAGEHEPAHTDIYKPDEFEDPTLFFKSYNPATGVASDPVMQPEKVTSLDLGFRHTGERMLLDVNGFYQLFDREIVAAGGLDINGNPVRTNAGKTVHRGVEGLFKFKPTTRVELSANATWSDNYFDSFSEYSTVFSSPQSGDTVYLPVASTVNISHAGNPIAGFPQWLAKLSAYAETPLGQSGVHVSGGFDYRYVGRLYLDQSGAPGMSIDPYGVINLRAGLRFGLGNALKSLALECSVNNVTDEHYSASGYTYYGVPYYYPAAERNVYVRLRTDW
jgi:iron complex outermembrane receptor protein